MQPLGFKNCFRTIYMRHFFQGKGVQIKTRRALVSGLVCLFHRKQAGQPKGLPHVPSFDNAVHQQELLYNTYVQVPRTQSRV